MNGNIRRNTLFNLIWLFFERFGAQATTFVLSILLARLIEPELFGRVAIITVFVSILQVIVDSGLGSALIQKKGADEDDFSCVFIFNLTAGCILYIVMFLAAPVIAELLNMDDMVWPIRVVSILLIVSGIKNVQQSYIAKNMKFRLFFFSTLAGSAAAIIVGISMALAGFGIWALICQSLCNVTIDTIVLCAASGYHPKLKFDIIRIKSLYSYGWKLLLSSLIYRIYNELMRFFVGIRYTERELAFYNYGSRIPEFICMNFNGAMDGVLFPSVSRVQDDRAKLKRITKISVETGSYIIMPVMTGLAVCAEPLTAVFLTEKWLPCVPYIRIFCISFMFYPIHTANLNVLKALGKSSIFLILEVIKTGIGILLLAFAMLFSPFEVALSVMILSVISIPVNMWPNRDLIDYKITEQIRDFMPSVILSLLMGAVVYLLGYFITSGTLIKLAVQVITGVVIYVLASKISGIKAYEYLISTLKELKKNG